MKKLNPKIKQEHTIMEEFYDFLNYISDNIYINRIIPGRITRKQSGSSDIFINYSYNTPTWLKYNIKKWSTSQELFIICDLDHIEDVKKFISDFDF